MKDLENRGIRDKYKPFIRGGLWDNFLTKYNESNLMHKKMLYVSEKIKKKKGKEIPPELRELYRGQCNCAYWHGLFGGLYLNYLRHAVYEHLIEAENIIDKKAHKNRSWIEYKVFDYDKDNLNEVLISNKKINAYFDPDYGGTMFEFDYRPKRFNLSNTLTRREEAYHHKIKDAEAGQHGGGANPKSIHDIVKVKEEGLGDAIVYDWYLRRSFVDHFLGNNTDIRNFMRCSYPELGNFVDKPYTVENISQDKKSIVNLTMRKTGNIKEGELLMPVSILKSFSLSKERAEIISTYEIANMGDKDIDIWFGIEFNLTLLAGDNELRYYIFKDGYHSAEAGKKVLNSMGEISDTKLFGMKDEWNRFQVMLSFVEPASLWYFPIETVSQSEDGFEKTYQGSAILSHWKMNLKSMKTKTIKLAIGIGEF